MLCCYWCSVSDVIQPLHSVSCFSSYPQSFPASGSFPEQSLRIMWPKYWRISLSPSSAYSRLISFHCSSVAKLWATLCNPMDCSTPGFLVHYQLPEFAQTDVHPVSYVIQLPHLLSSPSPVFNLSQHWVFIFFLRSQFWTSAGQSIGVSASAKVLPMNIQD